MNKKGLSNKEILNFIKIGIAVVLGYIIIKVILQA